MTGKRWASVIVGLILVLFGTIFALQGADILKGSPVMSGDPEYIYVGGILAIIGLVLVAVAASRGRRRSSSTAEPIAQ